MIRPGMEVFLRMDGDPRGERMSRGRVGGSGGGGCSVVLADAFAAERGRRVLIHYERDGRFVRRAAVVTAVSGAAVDLRVTGEAESAERRRKPRVSYLHVLQRVVSEPLIAHAPAST